MIVKLGTKQRRSRGLKEKKLSWVGMGSIGDETVSRKRFKKGGANPSTPSALPNVKSK
jgi:hypothetical protein